MKQGDKLPEVNFRVRSLGEWQDTNTDTYFKGKKVILFSLPGAFTPTCSNQQLPGFEKLADVFKEHGIDDIYCMSVNDSFVMNAWADKQKLENVKVIPDGNGEFTEKVGMLCSKRDKCFGDRSWRYAAIINDGVVEKVFEEPGKADDVTTDPYGESSPENVLKFLQATTNGNRI
jgi:peroxiredoxin